MRLRILVIATTLMAYAAPVMAQGVEVHDHSKKQGRGTVQVGAHAEAQVSGFSPSTGPVGTLVTINGANFGQQTKIKLGGRPVRVESFNATSITFKVPSHYYDGVITLHHPGMGNAIPVGTFQVQVDPRIHGFNPRSGPVGTRVELNGEGFQNGDQILFNSRPLPVAELGPNRVVITIPQGASSDFFSVYRPSTKYTWAAKQRFDVSMPAPTVSALTPTQGAPGTQVRITGSYFAPRDRVFYGPGQPVNVVGRADTWIDVQVPANARQSNPFNIRGKSGTVQTPVFVLVMNPTIARFQPDSGGPGTIVDIYGTNFAQGDQVYLNGRALRRTGYDDSKLTVEIPPGATTDRFAVWRNGAAIATASRPFEIRNAPTISGFSPTQGPGGTRVTISGSGFSRDTRVTYGAKPLNVVGRRQDNSIEVIVPPGAQSQPFTVINRGGSVNSASAFQVIEYSNVLSIAPTSGPVGTRVTINQSGYTGTDSFWLNGVQLPIVEKAPGRYVVQIPANATTGKIEWESYGRRQASNQTFQVTQPMTITSIDPLSARPGDTVKVYGTGFSGSAKFYFGDAEIATPKRNPTQAHIVVPRDATAGAVWISAGEPGGTRVRAPQQLQIVGSGITRIEPAAGLAGTEVHIYGSGFGGAGKVYLGQTEMKVAKRNPPQIIVVVPAGTPPGRQQISVEEYGQRVRSPQDFEVQGASITRMEPSTGQRGVTVRLYGTGFTGQGKVTFGGMPVKVVLRNPTQLTFVVPAEANPGPAAVVVEESGLQVKAPMEFVVQGAPKPSPPPPPPPPVPSGSCTWNATPAATSAGETVSVDISHCNVKNVKQAWWKGEKVTIVSSSPTVVVIRLPAKANGTDNVTLETDDGGGVAVRRRSSNKVTVKGGY
jgi:hypothetical protein